MTQAKELQLLTEKIISYLNTIEDKFQEVKRTGEKGEFYSEVKPFADDVKEINDRWLKSATAWVEETMPRNLFPKQIESAHEQIEMLSVQAFYPDTSLTRFKNYLQSVRFILTTLADLLQKKTP
ncbi:YppE family protein [Bacillus dakarensis]|uniref:YppE family protein n=1 Tax=Robertmurraya dakarensis TaxID=1926278 RepID=UPI0009825BB2|nr:YppE family protein [Bacillus dakarensis]